MLKGQVAIVTGGGRGIGRATCLALAKEGANIVVNDFGSVEVAQAVCDECIALGVDSIVINGDISDSSQVEMLINKTLDKFGRIDILVNNAGITRDNLLLRMSEADFDAVINTNLKGAFLCMKMVSPVMMKQRYGRIVSISSVVGVSGNAGQINYAASKAGIIGMTKSIAKELASRGITANAIAPGFIETDMTKSLPETVTTELKKNIPLKKLGKPEDIANAICFLVSDKANYITGQVLHVDGGMLM